MKTTFAYIDDVMDRAIEAEHATPNIPKIDREAAASKGRKIIGGFRVVDGGAERAALDGMIAKRRESIEKFRTDRAALRSKLLTLGVTPLAVCPTGAWYKICRDTALIVLSPDKDGRVGISPKWAEGVTKPEHTNRWDNHELIRKMFPDGVSVSGSTHRATVVLPDPPADVAATLCKVQSLALTVAAVPAAIRFAEKPSELTKANAHPKDQWAQAQGYADYADWVKRDPIIFTEHETATAIIAQFGDFPIEQQVVDAAVKSDALISAKPASAISVESYGLRSIEDDYERTIDQLLRQQGMRNAQELALEADRQRQLFEHHRLMTNAPLVYLSGDWTGR